MRDIKTALTCWANWSRGRLGMEYPSRASGLMGAKETCRKAPVCSDEEAVVIDAAVAKLHMFDETGYLIIVEHYKNKKSFTKIAKSTNKRTDYISAYAHRAEYYLVGALENGRRINSDHVFMVNSDR